MITTVIDICKNIIDFASKRKEIDDKNKEKISKILEEISLILEDTANKLSQDEYPHGNCVVMEKLSNELHSNLIKYFPEEDINDLHKALIVSSQVEREFANRKEPETIPTILRASGEFKAMSMILKIS